jgi:hypothetical protein
VELDRASSVPSSSARTVRLERSVDAGVGIAWVHEDFFVFFEPGCEGVPVEAHGASYAGYSVIAVDPRGAGVGMIAEAQAVAVHGAACSPRSTGCGSWCPRAPSTPRRHPKFFV